MAYYTPEKGRYKGLEEIFVHVDRDIVHNIQKVKAQVSVERKTDKQGVI